MMTECLIISGLAAEYAAELERTGDPSLSVAVCHSSQQALDRYSGQEVVFGDPDLTTPVLDRMDSVRWVQSTWAGVLPFLECERRDYLLTGVKNVFGGQMAEYVLGYVLAHELRIADRRSAQAKREWYREQSGMLAGKRIGILGTGSIGQHIARAAACFDMQVEGLSRSGAIVDGFAKVSPVSEIATFLSSVDYVVSTLPQTGATDRLLNEQTLAQLPPHAVFINVGRGNVVDDDALIDALRECRLAGAVLDVFDEEPVPKDSPLWTAPNLQITAHISAVSHPSLVVPIFVENLARYRSGETLKYVVDFDRGY